MSGGIDMSNIRLLGIYYATQKILLNNLAAPLGRSLKSVLSLVSPEDSAMLAEKTLKHLRPGVNQDKLAQVMKTLLTRIDSGDLQPQSFLGYEYTTEQTIDQFELHDSFMKVYDSFFEEASGLGADEKIARRKVAESVKGFKLSDDEEKILMDMFIGSIPRSPLTLTVEELRDIVDCMYSEVCDILGPTSADQCLSNSVRQAKIVVPEYDARVFL